MGKGVSSSIPRTFLKIWTMSPSIDPLDILHLDKGHLHIDLCEFRLAVRTEVFIPKAPDDLKVPVKPRDHQNLFKQLRGLGQGIKMTRIDPAWNQVVPGSFRGALGQHGGLDLQKPQPVKVVFEPLGPRGAGGSDFVGALAFSDPDTGT